MEQYLTQVKSTVRDIQKNELFLYFEDCFSENFELVDQIIENCKDLIGLIQTKTEGKVWSKDDFSTFLDLHYCLKKKLGNAFNVKLKEKIKKFVLRPCDEDMYLEDYKKSPLSTSDVLHKIM